MPISPPRLGDGGGAVVPATLLHAPPPLGLALAVDENLGGAQLLQELLLNVLGFDPSLLLLPARRCVSECDRVVALARRRQTPTLNWTATASSGLGPGTNPRRCG